MATFISANKDKLIYQAGLLGAACFTVSILLLVGNWLTTQPIAHHIAEDQKKLLAQVLPHKLYDNDPLAEVSTITATAALKSPVKVFTARKNGIVNGAGLQSSIQGWGGEIAFILGVNQNGEITGVRIISHKETPGLADKIEIEKDNWISSFDGKSLANTASRQWAVKKDKGEFDQFTGATITPRAVVKGVYQALTVYQSWRNEQIIKQTPAPSAETGEPTP